MWFSTEFSALHTGLRMFVLGEARPRVTQEMGDAAAGAVARLGADADRYSFIVVDLHHLLLASLLAHLQRSRTVHALVGMGRSRPATECGAKIFCNRATGSSQTSRRRISTCASLAGMTFDTVSKD